ncbi:MAG: hypothetical protein Q7R30_22440, partial [Acidobacteriota bacterium]|nr:hypothetical protein [Acidobacteriota bacterium]
MKRYLILSTLDVSRMPNNRDHHLLQHIAPRFDETYVVFRKRCDKQGKLQFLRDAFVPRARVARRGGVSYVEVNPLLNHAQGLAMDVAGTYDVREHERGRFNLRQAAYRLLTSLGIFKDLSSIFFLFWFAWRKAPGKFDVCTALGPWAGASAFLLKKLGKVRVTVFEDRDYEPGFLSTPLRRRMAVAIEVAALKAADLRVSVGGRLARLRQSQTGMPVATVHNGVAVDNFQAPLRDLSQPILVYTGAV